MLVLGRGHVMSRPSKTRTAAFPCLGQCIRQAYVRLRRTELLGDAFVRRYFCSVTAAISDLFDDKVMLCVESESCRKSMHYGDSLP